MIYKVTGNIEHGGILHLPEGSREHLGIPADVKVPSMGGVQGGCLVDRTGFIEMTESEAAPHMGGALASLDSEIEKLEKKRDEALAVAKRAQADLDARKAQLAQLQAKRAALGIGGIESAAIANTEPDGAEDESFNTPTVKCVAVKDFTFNGEKYREAEEVELTLAVINAMGKKRIKVVDVDAYEAAKLSGIGTDDAKDNEA